MVDEEGEKHPGVETEKGDENKAAPQCRRRQACRALAGEPRCRVVDCVADQVFFVEAQEERICSYCQNFGESCYCNCPVRQELYLKHRR